MGGSICVHMAVCSDDISAIDQPSGEGRRGAAKENHIVSPFLVAFSVLLLPLLHQ